MGLCIVKGVFEFFLVRRRVCLFGLLLIIIMDFFFLISKLFLVYDEKWFDKGYVMFLFKNWLNVFDFIFRFLLKVVGVLEMGGGFM